MESDDGRPTLDLTTRYDGPWSEADVQSFLRDTRVPMRLATNTPSGFPVIVSIWYLYDDGANPRGGARERQDREAPP